MENVKKVKNDLIKCEIERRIEAINLLTEGFELDGVTIASPYLNSLYVIGDFDKVAEMFGAEVYEYDRDGKQIKAFELDGVEVYSRV